MRVTAIIAAGGRGRRLGGGLPKQLLTIDGRPILERSVAAFLGHPDVDEIVVALPAELAADPPAYLRGAPKPITIVTGGSRRQDSVAAAFEAAGERPEVIVIHDAARPFVSARVISETIATAALVGAAVAAVPARDTVKRVDDPGEAGAHADTALRGERLEPGPRDRGAERGGEGRSERGHAVRETLPRERIYLAQTPQAFRREVLRDALALAAGGVDVTDEATLAERAGHAVRLVEGEETNIKITTPADLVLGEAIARSQAHAGAAPPACVHRIGTGYDLHRLVPGRPLMLGGIEVPSPVGPLGHSDGDVVCHAVTDAILGAASLGDIGRHFPDTDPRWKGASSLDLLARAVRLVADSGYDIANVDVTIILEKPKVKEHLAPMRARLARALAIPAANVSVKGKTNEGVDAVGRGEAVAAHAVALIQRRRSDPSKRPYTPAGPAPSGAEA
jgi:2-C-methyl-D-erythritol 4-phosphate cytidylyltransferase/2-C-methyl-D-erythritol 2,4-cyclodiphosphate synthase